MNIRKTVTVEGNEPEVNEQPLDHCNERVASLFEEKSDLTQVTLVIGNMTKVYDRV
jgi:hypothetical protein